MQAIRKFLKDSAVAVGIGEIEIEIIKERYHVKIYAIQLNPAAVAWSQDHPVIHTNPHGFSHPQITEWKIGNSKFHVVMQVSREAFEYINYRMERGELHPAMYDLASQLHGAWINFLQTVKTDETRRFAVEPTPTTTPRPNVLQRVLRTLARWTKPRVFEIPFKPKGIYPSTGLYVDDVENAKLLQLLEDLRNERIR